MKLRIGLLEGGGPVAEEDDKTVAMSEQGDKEKLEDNKQQRKTHRGKRKNKDGVAVKMQEKWNASVKKWKGIMIEMKRIKETKEIIQKKKEQKKANKMIEHDQWFGNKIQT